MMPSNVNRRGFLAATAALAAGLSAPRSHARAAANAASDKSFTLGFSLYGMKSLPIDAALKACAEIGFHDVEPSLLSGYDTEPKQLSPTRRREIRGLLDSLGLAAPAVMENIRAVIDDAGQRENLEKIARAAELAHAWKPAGNASPAVMETVLGGKPSEWEQLREPMIQRLRQWAGVAKKHDLVIAIKAHVGGALHTPEDTSAVVREIASPHLRAVYDFSHFQLQGFDLEKSLRILAPETVFIHVKDGRGVPGKFEFLLPGEGTTDYVRYFRLLRELNYRGSVTVEVSGQIHQKAGYDPIDAARKCYRVLQAAYEKSAAASG